MDHVARADDVQQVLRIVGMCRVFHRVEVIEVAEELVEAVDSRQKFILVAKVILAELAGGIPHVLEHSGNGHRLGGQAYRRAGLPDRSHAGADRQHTGDEVRPARRATCLGVVVGKQHPLFGQFIEVRRTAGHQAAMVGADVPHADVVAHDDNDVGFRPPQTPGPRLIRSQRRIRQALLLHICFASSFPPFQIVVCHGKSVAHFSSEHLTQRSSSFYFGSITTSFVIKGFEDSRVQGFE